MMLLILLHIFFVSFTDKPEKSAPALSPRAIEQRAKWSIPTDELDYPVCSMYLDSLRKMGVEIQHTSRWFNGATCAMSFSLAKTVVKLSFVTDVEMTRNDSSSPLSMRKFMRTKQDSVVTLWSAQQQAVYNLQPLHDAGFEGQGILMTICDAGFQNSDSLPCYRRDSLELGHFDFTDNDYSFYGDGPGTFHGNNCLSFISGIQEGYHGAATQAKYYLMRSEEGYTESPKEMDNLVAAMEKADSLGTNIFSCSLGYFNFDNPEWNLYHNMLDGKTTRVSRAATIAARKGMLLCIAAGNEGNKNWIKIDVPADADSILTVGAVGYDSICSAFSSYGPSADGRVKPEVCAVGVYAMYINYSGQILGGNGTSYATPLLAGLAASLWSALPDENAMQIRERIIRSADRYANPDSVQYGYGIPDAWKAYTMTLPQAVSQTNAATNALKIIRNGQVLIVRNGHTYDVAGRKVE